MGVGFARPDISELVFHVYDRSVHPELFQILMQREYSSGNLHAKVSLCETGHVVSVEYNGKPVTELFAANGHPLPRTRRCFERRLRGQRDTSLRFHSGLCYHASYQLEQLDPEVFLNLHEELWLDCEKAEISHRFQAVTRLSPGPLSLIQVDATAGSLLIHAYHTYPDNCAIVKTQSLFEAG